MGARGGFVLRRRASLLRPVAPCGAPGEWRVTGWHLALFCKTGEMVRDGAFWRAAARGAWWLRGLGWVFRYEGFPGPRDWRGLADGGMVTATDDPLSCRGLS